MSRLYYQQTTTSTTSSLPEARKLANKQRRQAGRERHEERKAQLKGYERDHRWEKRSEGNAQKRRDDGTRGLAGRNLYNQRVASVLYARATDIMGVAAEDDEEQVQVQAYDAEEQLVVPQVTSGATLLAMARPAKSRRRRCPPAMQMTDGEAFEIVEVDGRLVALDEDGWEILPDENAEDSYLYSDIVRGVAR